MEKATGNIQCHNFILTETRDLSSQCHVINFWKFSGKSLMTHGSIATIEQLLKRRIIRPAFEGMWLSLQDSFCRFQTALWFAPVVMC